MKKSIHSSAKRCERPRWMMGVLSLSLSLPLLITPTLSAAPDAVPTELPVVRTEVQSNTFVLTGTVVDEQGEPLIGARVSLVENTSKGTMTDIDGAFRLPGVQLGQTVEVAFVGYKTQRIKLQSKDALHIALDPDNELLDEVVVTAFGTGQKKASIVGSVQTVRPGELKVPATNLSTSFAGRLAGVISVQRSGAPGADGADFWIRGISSVNQSSPLIILDGVQVSAGDLNALDPEVIEGFSILKDATATALYGSRGANGVVIVTTKTGANLDKPVINVRLEGYMNTPTSVPQFVDGVSYMHLYNEALGNLSTGNLPYPIDKIRGTEQGLDPYAFPNVMWYDELFRKAAFNQKANLNVRGGSKKLNYFMSVTADHQTGMLKPVSKDFYDYNNELQYMRYAFQNNVELNLSETTKVALRLNAQIGSSRGPRESIGNIFSSVINSNPVDFPIRFPADEITPYIKWGTIKVGPAQIDNPVAKAVYGYNDNFNSTVIVNFEVNQDLKMITEGLRLTALASFKNWSQTVSGRYRDHNFFELNNYERQEDGTYVVTPKLVGAENNTDMKSAGSTNGDRTIYFHTMLLWDRTFGDHAVGAMLNYNQEEYSTNVANDNILNNLPRRKQGIAGRITYAYANRYILEANFGYNGSENFAKGHRFGFFPSVALGYNISEESFWEPIKDYIPLLKLRGSYGLVGNDRIGGDRFVYMEDINLSHGSRGYTTGINQDYTLNGPKYNRFGNPGITWEVGEKLNVGFDLQILKPLRLNVDFFREYRRNVFQQRGAVPSYMGTAGTKIYGNLAEISNKGLDLSLEYNQQINKDFFINLRGTFTYAKNNIEKWDEPAFMEYPELSGVGHSLNTHLALEAERLFVDKAEVLNSPEQQWMPRDISGGDIKYKDQPNAKGEYDGKIDNNDRVHMGYPKVPQIIYGFGTNMRYRSVDFGIFFQGAAQTSLMLGGFHPFGTQYNRNVLQFIADDHWSPDNQNVYAKYPRLTKMDMTNNTQASSYWLRDGSFLKLKNIELGYNFKNARLYLSGMNVLTFSKFKLWDPERGGGNGLSYPTQRTFNVGLQMTF